VTHFVEVVWCRFDFDLKKVGNIALIKNTILARIKLCFMRKNQAWIKIKVLPIQFLE
jgi:hypothetical protein